MRRETATGEGHRAPAKPGKYTHNPINDKIESLQDLSAPLPPSTKEKLLIPSVSPVGQPQLTANLGKEKPQYSVH